MHRFVVIAHVVIALSLGIGGFCWAGEPVQSEQFGAERLDFPLGASKCFVILPAKEAVDGAKPWVWYAPTFIGGHPDPSHTWMARQLLDAGFSICGVDVGESYGSPAGTRAYNAFYKHVRRRYGLDPKACLLAQSRGGLMLLNWAAENADHVACVAGIYAVCNLESYPGLETAGKAYGMDAEELRAKLSRYNPIERVKPLVDRRVPQLYIHGDSDTVVPIEKNSGELVRRCRALGGHVKLITVAGKGHEVCPEFFESSEVVRFLLSRGKSAETTILVEAEAFAITGGWVIDQQFMDEMGSPFLLAHGLGQPVADASAPVVFPEAGDYRVWVRTRDWVAPWKTPDTPESKKAQGSPGRFQVFVDGNAVDTVFGTEGAEWHWQAGGSIWIDEKQVTLALHDLTGFEGRCDAILFSTDMRLAPPNSVKEMASFRRKLLGFSEEPANGGAYDLVVVGGGIAGTCAAVSAARNGLEVAFIQDRPVLGGNNSSEVRVWLSGTTHGDKYPRLGGVLQELEQERKAHYGPDNTADLYEDDKKEALVRSEPNISLFLNHRGNSVEAVDDRITAVIAQNVVTGERLRFSAKWFADCTGDGSIGFLAGADYAITRKGHMGRCNLWNVKGTGKAVAFPRCPWALDLSEKPFPGRDNRPGVNTGKGIEALGGWYWESGFDHDPIRNREYIRDWNFRGMYGAWDCLKNVDNRYPNHKLNWAAYISGPRESRRLLGPVVLSKEDLLNQREFEDGCVVTGWDMDLHLPHPAYVKGFEGDAFIAKDYHTKYPMPYWLPYRILYSRNVKNLFMAGRDVSVTHEALGSVRVMRTGGLMGEVVGLAAALCKKHDADPHDVYEHHLAEFKDLLARGVNVAPGSGNSAPEH